MAKVLVVVPIVLLVLVAVAGATPPGIANNPSHATCKIKKYKHCYNLVHVCPKFCPAGCTVECASCKPICVGAANNPPSPYPPPSIPSTPENPPPSPSTPSTPENPPPSSPTPSTPENPPPSPSIPSTPENPPPSSPTPTPSTPENPTPSSPTPTPSTPENPPPSPSTPSTPENPPSSPTPTPPTHENPTPSPSTPSSPPENPTPSPSTPSSPENPPPATPSTPSPATPSTPSPATPSPSTPENPPPPTSSTPPSSPSPSPSTPSSPKTARCRNKNYPKCYNMEHVCPSACPGGCEVDCYTCKPVCKCDKPGAVCQDPRFIGGDGITFYFHGKKDRNFCLVSDQNLHINAHFIGRTNPTMSRDFTWVQSIAILFHNHRLFIGAHKTATWQDSVDRLALSFDGEPISIPQSEGATWQSPIGGVSIARDAGTNSVAVEVEGKLKITAKVVPITEQESRVHNYGVNANEDCFAHLDLGFKFLSLSDEVSGVLGQTYRPSYVRRVNIGVKMAVMGGVTEFETSDLFSADCSVARFVGSDGNSNDGNAMMEGFEIPGLSCASGVGGDGQGGVVCKR